MTKREMTLMSAMLTAGGFRQVFSGTEDGIRSTRLDLPGKAAVVFTTTNGKTWDVHTHWRQTGRPSRLVVLGGRS